MKRFLQTDKNSSIGLDIGRNSIKAVQLRRREDGNIALLAFGKKNIPNTRNVDTILHPSHYLPALFSILHSPNYGEFVGKDFVVALPNRHTYIQHNVSVDEFVQQANNALGTTVDELMINTYRHSPSLSVSIASAQTLLDQHLSALADIGTVTNSDHEISAAIRTLNTLTQPTLVVDIGSTESTVGVYSTLLILAQKVDFGVYTLCNFVARQFNLTYTEASEMLFSFGYMPSSLQIKIRQASKVAMLQFIKNLKNNIEEYNVKQIIVCGGGAAIPAIAEYIQENVNITTTIANPWERIGQYPLKPIPKKIAPIFATAVGLALLDLG